MVTLEDFVFLAENDPEIDRAFRKAVRFSMNKRSNEFEEFNCFSEIEEDVLSTTRLVHEYISLLRFPFEDSEFRDYLLKADRFKAETLLGYNCRGYPFETVKEVIEEAITLRESYKKDIHELWHNPAQAERAAAVKRCCLFTKVPFGVVNFYLEATETLDEKASQLLADALLHLFSSKETKFTAYSFTHGWKQLGTPRFHEWALMAGSISLPQWSPYMWKEYFDRFEELGDLFLPWVEEFLASKTLAC